MKFGMKAMNPAQKKFKNGDLNDGVRLFANGVLGEGGFEKLPSELKEYIMENSKALRAELLGEGFPEFNRSEAENLNIPTLLLTGEKSPEFFRTISDKLFQLLPDKELMEIPDSAHDMHLDNPKVYNQKVMEFLLRYN